MPENILEIKNLSFSYSDAVILDNFSMDLKKGEKLIISGPNGSGKTTLLKCIMGLLKPSEGTVSKADSINIAYCKQDYPNSKFPISAREVVAMGSKDKQAVKEAMERTNTLNLADRSFYSLSGGERQKVSLARCFCQKANLLLFDEPSSFLDSKSRASFTQMIKQLPDEIAAIVVTHDMELAKELGWRILEMEER